jgi:hexokinase
VQGACQDRRTRIGIILGTGTNAAFLEIADRVKHWEQKRHGEHHVVIDVEWGGNNTKISLSQSMRNLVSVWFFTTISKSSLISCNMELYVKKIFFLSVWG